MATNLPQLHLLQQPPFRFVDQLVAWDDKGAESLFCIRENSLFVDQGYFLMPGIVENMAQTCAAWVGQKAFEEGRECPVIPLGAVSNVYLKRFPCVQETLRTKVRFVDSDFGVVMIQADTFVGNEKITGAVLKARMIC